MMEHGLGPRIGRFCYLGSCVAVFAFLVAPILVIVPLSFNAEPYFTFTEGMLRLDPEAYSLRWYRQIVEEDAWTRALANSLIIGVASTALATALGTLASLGLSSAAMPGRRLAMGLLISPMVTPVIISAAGMFFFYSSLGLSQSYIGLILAHAALGTPFVVITVTATLSAFDANLTRAAASLGGGAAAHLPQRATAADRAGGRLRGPLRLRHLIRRSSGGALHGRRRAAHHPAPDVGGHPRADQPHHPGRGDLPDRLRGVAAVRGRMAAPAVEGGCGRLSRRSRAPWRELPGVRRRAVPWRPGAPRQALRRCAQVERSAGCRGFAGYPPPSRRGPSRCTRSSLPWPHQGVAR